MTKERVLIGKKIDKVKELFTKMTPQYDEGVDAEIAKEDFDMHLHMEK